MRSQLPELINPFDETRIVNCSYELSMGSEAHITGEGSKTKRELDDQEQIHIPPGQFAQLLTFEIVSIPDSALGFISIKSRFKSRGLVNVSGFHVDPGYKGRLLFSVYNAGPNYIALSQGTPTFLLWYSFLDLPTADLYGGARSGLEVISDEDVMRLQGDVYSPQALAERVAAIEKWFLTFRRWGGIAMAAVITTLLGALVTALIALAVNQF